MKKSCWFLSSLRDKYKYYLIDFYTDNYKVYVFSKNKYSLVNYRYRHLNKSYFVTSVRSVSILPN